MRSARHRPRPALRPRLFSVAQSPHTLHALLILTRTHCSDQALPVAVLINKMDRKDAWPFPELEVPLPLAPRVQRSLTPRDRKASMTPPALSKVDPMLHRKPSRGTCAASRRVCPSPKGTR